MEKVKFNMMINGLKYDTEQAIAICNIEYKLYGNPHRSIRTEKIGWFKNEVIIKTLRRNTTYDYTIYKGVNNHYFMHQIVWSQFENTNDVTKEIELGPEYINNQTIIPLSKEEAFNYYFNGYDLKIKEHGVDLGDYLYMTQLVSDKEAFDKIPFA